MNCVKCFLRVCGNVLRSFSLDLLMWWIILIDISPAFYCENFQICINGERREVWARVYLLAVSWGTRGCAGLCCGSSLSLKIRVTTWSWYVGTLPPMVAFSYLDCKCCTVVFASPCLSVYVRYPQRLEETAVVGCEHPCGWWERALILGQSSKYC